MNKSRGNESLRRLRSNEPIPPGEPRRYRTSRGYIVLRWKVGPNQYVDELEHRVIMGRPDGEVHHINGIKDDNRPENLQVLTKEEHGRLHGSRATRRYAPYRSRADWEAGQRQAARAVVAQARLEEMIRLYEGGLSTTEVGQRVGLDCSGVSRKLRAAGVTMRPPSSKAFYMARRGAA